jgi:hypothetical protein
MPAEWRFALAAVLALSVGALGAERYARFATPLYRAAAGLIAAGHPWKVLEVGVSRSGPGGSAILRLTGEVRRHREDVLPAAVVVGKLQVGEVVETPIVFWTLLLAWPARTLRERLRRCALGLPVFIALELAIVPLQLTWGMAEASAELAGVSGPLTLWERWSNFLEAGGGFVLQSAAAVATVAAAQQRWHRSREAPQPGVSPAAG